MDDNFDLQAAIEKELAAAVETSEPICSLTRLTHLSQLIDQLLTKAANACQEPEELRFVAAVFKGAVDLWYPRR